MDDSKPSERGVIDRRGVLKGATVGAGALAAWSDAPSAQSAEPAAPKQSGPPAISQSAEIATHEPAAPAAAGKPGSDFMVDVLKTLDFEYCCTNPGSSVRWLHESILNYGGNQTPELLTCCHEESAVAMGHGYAKIAGKPLLTIAHGTVGLQHAAMALYNAWCDRAPVVMMIGNEVDATRRGGEPGWNHSAQDPASMARDFLKWDDAPASLEHFAESTLRAYRVATTPPMAPVLLVLDAGLQARPAPASLKPPPFSQVRPPAGDPSSVEEAARLLVNAARPVIVAERAARTAEGLALMVQLAEALQAGVVDRHGRLNFPTRHVLNQSDRANDEIYAADVILALEVADRYSLAKIGRRNGAKLITISSTDLYLKSNYQNFGRYFSADLAMAADAEATLPSLIHAVKRLSNSNRRAGMRARGAKLAELHREALQKARVAASYAWNASPISTARLYAELWNCIRHDDWSLVSDPLFQSNWPLRLWDMDRHYHFIGGSGAYGIGYGAPAAVGAALANRKHGRLSVNVQADGDLMYAPGILWTAAHHRIPLLSVMHNNRAYNNELMWTQKTAVSRDRGIGEASVGNVLSNPNIDFAQLARSMGVWAVGPISEPNELGPALKQALAVVRSGEPALVDVVSQPR